jgi:hypothetical protein
MGPVLILTGRGGALTGRRSNSLSPLQPDPAGCVHYVSGHRLISSPPEYDNRALCLDVVAPVPETTPIHSGGRYNYVHPAIVLDLRPKESQICEGNSQR